ncbi:MAG: hypothetical protein ACD_39C00251G0002 [uncultured bacterium]|nr:MAG: hypothetical protein ACD_39C00251G0002 [uncultured bacterium]
MADAMQETKHKFYELADELLRESGLLPNRPTWIKLRQLVHDSAADFLQNDYQSDTYSLLLVLLKTPEKSAERIDMLGTVIESAIMKAPDESFIELLKQLSSDDLVKTLLPRMYRADSRGSAAVYLAARLAMHLAPEAFQYFLCARLWQQTDLINLSFLVRPSDTQKVCSILAEAVESEQSVVNKEAFNEFRHILLNQTSHHLLLPDVEPVSSSLAEQRQIVEPVIPPPPKERTAESKNQPAPILRTTQQKVAPVSEQKSKTFLQLPPALVNLVEVNRTAFIILFVMTTLTLLATGFSSWLVSDSAPTVYAQRATARTPKYWTDSASKEQITQRYLAADKDYRMGELYLTRDCYSEALILFEDALAVRPDHLQALYRVGYCRLNIKDFAGARTALEKALKINPAFRHANLLLARVAVAQNDNQLAEKHFKLELGLDKDPMVAVEYANFLQSSGKDNEAKAIIAQYQALYPDRILVLSKKPDNSDNQEQRQ